MSQVEIKERLPDWTQEEFERYRMNQFTQILERRFLTVEESLIDIQFRLGAQLGSGTEFAPLEHTHGESEISDLGEGSYYVSTNYVSSELRLTDIWDIDDTGLANDTIIKWSDAANGGEGGWIIDNLSAIGNTLAGLIDTNISSPSAGDLLQYDDVTAKWVNTTTSSFPFVQRTGDIMIGDLLFLDLQQVQLGSAGDFFMRYDGSQTTFRGAALSGDWLLELNGGEDAIRARQNGAVELYFDGLLAFSVTTDGGFIRDTTAASPVFTLQDSVAADLAFLQSAGGELLLRNLSHGDVVRIQGEEAGGTLRNLVVGDPDADVQLFWDGDPVLLTEATGIGVRNDTGGGTTTQINLYDDVGSVRARLSASTSNTTYDGLINGNPLLFRANDAGSILRNILQGDPDAGTSLYYAGDNALDTIVTGIRVSETNLSNEPVVEFYTDTATWQGTVGANHAGSYFYLRAQPNSDHVRLQGYSSGGVLRDLLAGDPDAGVSLDYAGGSVFSTFADGVVLGATVTELEIFTDSNFYNFIGRDHGDAFLFSAEQAGGFQASIWLADPDGGQTWYFAANAVMNLVSSGLSITGRYTVDQTGDTGIRWERTQEWDAHIEDGDSSWRLVDVTNAGEVAITAVPNGKVGLGFNGVEEIATKASGVVITNELEVDGDLNHDGTNIGFYGVAPVARPSAYTQTFATADRTHAARTALSLTDSTTGTAGQTIADVGASFSQSTLNNNFASVTDEINKLIADLADTAELVNSMLDDLQANGILQ